MAKGVTCLTLNLGPDLDLGVVRSGLALGSTLGVEPA